MAKIAANAVRNTKVAFMGLDYYYLLVYLYLYLVLGMSEMNRLGLSGCIPRTKKVDDNNI